MHVCVIYMISIFVHPWLSFYGSYRCLGQDDPCEGISLGACFVEPGSILKTYTATPERCSHLKISWKLFWNNIENLHKTYWGVPSFVRWTTTVSSGEPSGMEHCVTCFPATINTWVHKSHYSKDFSQDCESFAGAVTVKDCTEGPDSCYAYVEDDCVYTGERVGEVVGGLQAIR